MPIGRPSQGRRRQARLPECGGGVSRCSSSRTSPRQFGGTQALNNVGMHVSAGEIVALLGENGAGKSTLIKILASVYSLDQGR